MKTNRVIYILITSLILIQSCKTEESKSTEIVQVDLFEDLFLGKVIKSIQIQKREHLKITGFNLPLINQKQQVIFPVEITLENEKHWLNYYEIDNWRQQKFSFNKGTFIPKTIAQAIENENIKNLALEWAKSANEAGIIEPDEINGFSRKFSTKICVFSANYFSIIETSGLNCYLFKIINTKIDGKKEILKLIKVDDYSDLINDSVESKRNIFELEVTPTEKGLILSFPKGSNASLNIMNNVEWVKYNERQLVGFHEQLN